MTPGSTAIQAAPSQWKTAVLAPTPRASVAMAVVMAQSTIKGGMALASGLILGIMFSAGAFGTLLSGPLADSSGFPLVFQMTAGLVIMAALVTLRLRDVSMQAVAVAD